MPHKKLFISLGAAVFGLIFWLILLLTGYFSPTLPAVIVQEVQVGTLKGVSQRIIQLNPPEENPSSVTRLVVAPRQDNAPELRLTSVDIQPETKPEPSLNPSTNDGALATTALLEKNWIQVGTFTDPNNLNRVLENLKTHNLPPSTETTTINGKAGQRVFIGPFQTQDQLDQHLKALETLGYQGYAVKRANP